MIVRRVSDLDRSDRHVVAPTWESRRILVAADGMGFSLHETEILEGTRTEMCYRNHLEAVYCISGAGVLEDTRSGRHHPIVPGTVYALDQHDEHVLVCHERLRLLCVFNPPCVGDESHDADGSYPAAPAEPA